MARRGLDQMSAWILAIFASGAVFGGGVVVAKVIAKRGHGGAAHGGGHAPASGEHGSVHGAAPEGHVSAAGGDDTPAGPGSGAHGDAAKGDHDSGAHGTNGTKAPSSAHGPRWEYKGSAGPDRWSELTEAFKTCKVGGQQSPIDIDAPVSNGKLLPIHFEYKQADVKVVNEGHSLQLSYPHGNYVEIDGERFDLQQIHFHTPSEHKVAGIPYDFELHLVHKNAEGRLAVVSVLFEEGGAAPTLEKILLAARREAGTAGEEIAIDANVFLPKKRNYYNYQGSLTTPPCSEGVRWFVLAQPMAIGAKQVDAFVSLVSFNARPVQPLKGRRVLKSAR